MSAQQRRLTVFDSHDWLARKVIIIKGHLCSVAVQVNRFATDVATCKVGCKLLCVHPAVPGVLHSTHRPGGQTQDALDSGYASGLIFQRDCKTDMTY